jgi:drug/metabolite transporter (DMT)-like permease
VRSPSRGSPICAGRSTRWALDRFGRRPAIYVFLATTLVLWASAFVGIRFALRAYDPVDLAVLRFGAASGILLLIGRLQGVRLPARADFWRLLWLGASGIALYNVALNRGEQTATAGEASFIVNTVPLLTTLLACVFFRERPTVALIAGAVLSLAGVSLISVGSSQTHSLSTGAAYVSLAALAQAAFFVWQRPLLGRYRPLEITCYSIWIGTALLLPLAPGLPRRLLSAPGPSTLAVCYLGVFPAALGNLCWSLVLKRWTASTASQFLFLVPVITLALGSLALGERPGPRTLLGGTLALLGVIVGRSGVSRASTPASSPARPEGA